MLRSPKVHCLCGAQWVALPALLLSIGLTACSTSVVNTTSQLPPASPAPVVLPRPQRVLVVDFGVENARLSLDQGVGPRLERALQGSDPAADQQQMLDDVQNAIADTLVAGLQKMGLPAERASDTPSAFGNTVTITGQILRVDQGNRTRRLGIGFGAGKSDVAATVRVAYSRPGGAAQTLQTYDADSNSGHKPGLALGAASAASGGSIAPAVLTGVTGVAGERNKSEVAKEGEKLAGHVAYDLGEFFAQQGWIPASAVPTPSLR